MCLGDEDWDHTEDGGRERGGGWGQAKEVWLQLDQGVTDTFYFLSRSQQAIGGSNGLGGKPP